jgi:hypothetical protein
LAWWWERLDQYHHYPHYRPLSQFLADVPWTGGELQPFTAEAANGAVRVVGLQTRQAAWVWCFHRAAAWRHIVTEGRTPVPVRDAQIVMTGLEDGAYRASWWDTREGRELATATVATREGRLTLRAPEFTHDLAVRVRR